MITIELSRPVPKYCFLPLRLLCRLPSMVCGWWASLVQPMHGGNRRRRQCDSANTQQRPGQPFGSHRMCEQCIYERGWLLCGNGGRPCHGMKYRWKVVARGINAFIRTIQSGDKHAGRPLLQCKHIMHFTWKRNK